MAKSADETPMMRQYNAIKAKYPGTMLLFRVGDFYETYGDDAVKAARILDIILTRRGAGSQSEMEMAGFPYHALEVYMPRLVRAGQRVAICDQLEDPKTAKGIVKRGVTEIVTPGIVLSDKIISARENNYLCVLHYTSNGQAGAAFLDISTGEFFCLSDVAVEIEKLLGQLRPAEVVVPRRDYSLFQEQFENEFYTNRLEDYLFDYRSAERQLLDHFQVHTLKGFGLGEDPLSVIAAGVLIYYLKQNEQHNLGQISRLYRLDNSSFLGMDAYTVRNLELVHPLHPDGRALIEVMDRCRTPMGARMLRRWLLFPLRELAPLQLRQERVANFLEDKPLHERLQQLLSGVGDTERLLARLAARKINPRECLALKESLAAQTGLQQALQDAPADVFQGLAEPSPTAEKALALLAERLQDSAPPKISDGGVMRSGLNVELDELRNLQTDAVGYLKDVQDREAQRLGIPSLKISYNKVFGYYIEITHTHRDKVPTDYIRKQTLTNAERYITPELKEFEEKILTASERIERIETALYLELTEHLQAFIPDLQTLARQVAEVDVLCGLATVAVERRYCRPVLGTHERLYITQGRHPVIESLLPPERPYIPNDLSLDTSERQIALITGPNMAGKSALLRQTALILLLAQIGSYVPATTAEIGLADRLYTRVGASDNLSAGESTFMVEMNETASILNTSTRRSLVILDEIGRGTSTFDGISIAWALTEHLHNQIGARTLFATHYHELAQLEDLLPRVHNWHMTISELAHELGRKRLIFLYKLAPGASEHSFGIHVAEMAGLPSVVLSRARELLHYFEERAEGEEDVTLRPPAPQSTQMRLFQVEDEFAELLRQHLRQLDTDRLTPMEALLKLSELKKLVEKRR
jgi:DNA mismatch repair protein MutS